MKKILVLVLLTGISFCATAQKLSFGQLEELLALPLDATEEKLFLIGYSFLSKDTLPEIKALTYTFTNRKNTIGSAKKFMKAVYNDNSKALVRYITYHRGEFETFRKLMIEDGFTRSLNDNISENSNFYKDNLHVNFEVTKDKYENPTFLISLSRDKPEMEKAQKKFSLRNFIKK